MTRPTLLLPLALVVLTATGPASAALVGPGLNVVKPQQRSVRMAQLRVGESTVLPFRWVTKVAVGNPAVADVVVVSDDEVLVNGKGAGETNLFVWDRRGRADYRVVVTGAEQAPLPDLTARMAAARRDLAGLPAEAQVVGETLFLTGEVPDAEMKARAEATVAAHGVKYTSFLRVAAAPQPPTQRGADVAAVLNRLFAGGPVSARALDDRSVALEGNVPDKQAEQAMQVAKSLAGDVTIVGYFHPASPRMRQVVVRTRVLEVNKQRTRDLGIDWGSVLRDGGQLVISQPFIFAQRPGGGGLPRLQPLGASLQALEQQNAVRVLSEPNLLVMEGNKGQVLIGGEIPIPVPQGGNSNAVTITFKPFGISLDVNVLGISEQGISLQVRPEVSMIDPSTAVLQNGFRVPGLRTNRAETTVRIRPGESLAIGGLVQQNEVKQTSRVPILSKIPILGELFKSRSFQKGESELVILVTPELKEDN